MRRSEEEYMHTYVQTYTHAHTYLGMHIFRPPTHPTLQLASTSQAKRRYRADRRHLVLHAAAVYKHSARPILQHATLDTIPMMPPPGPVQVRPLRLSPSPSFALFPSVVPSLPEVNLLRFTDLAYLHSYIHTHIARDMMSNPH